MILTSEVGMAVITGKELRFKNVKPCLRTSIVLYLLTTLPDKEFEEMCKPTTTQKEILA